MEYRDLGSSGLRVSVVGLGTMMLGAWGNRDHAECRRIVDIALDAGITLVDTADVYADGETERIVSSALRGRRDDVVLATKVIGPMGGDPNRGGGSRRWIAQACEDSLRRLQTDRIDLYQLHTWDPSVDLAETLGALTDLVAEGKVVAAGVSNYHAEEVVEALWVCERDHQVRICCAQPPYSIFVRSPEASLLPTCRRHRLGVIAYSPLNGGWLSGRIRRDRALEHTGRTDHYPEKFDTSLAHNARKLDCVEALAALASDAGLSLLELAIAFVVSQPVISSALLGPRTPSQLEAQLAAAEVRLDASVLERIDAIVPPGTVIDLADAGLRAAPAPVAWHERQIARVK